MTSPAAAASPISGSINSAMPDGMQTTLRSGLELTRASQLTLLRLQLALHKSNRRAAMQALDNLLDIDAEMEGLAARLGGVPMHLAEEESLSGFIGLQKAAIAAEKHALTGGDLRRDARAIAVSAPDDWESGTDVPAQLLHSGDEAEDDEQTNGGRWIYVLVAAIIVLGCGATVYLWPTLSVTLASL